MKIKIIEKELQELDSLTEDLKKALNRRLKMTNLVYLIK